MPAKTANAALQQKLDELAAFAAQNNIKAFVEAFVPLDCSPEDTANYLSVLTEDDAEWAALSSEIQAIADGATVEKIEGNQKTRAVFFFPSAASTRTPSRVRRSHVGSDFPATCILAPSVRVLNALCPSLTNSG